MSVPGEESQTVSNPDSLKIRFLSRFEVTYSEHSWGLSPEIVRESVEVLSLELIVPKIGQSLSVVAIEDVLSINLWGEFNKSSDSDVPWHGSETGPESGESGSETFSDSLGVVTSDFEDSELIIHEIIEIGQE